MNAPSPELARLLTAEQLWYKDAIIYEVHVRAFADSNADGISDFPGLTGKLDHLADLGVTAVWVLPFYPSPLKDDGYDIADYRDVHPEYGKMVDVKHFIAAAHKRGLELAKQCRERLEAAQQQVRVLEGEVLKPLADAGERD